MTAVKGRCNATAVARYATSPESVQSKRNKNSMIKLKIRDKKVKYMPTLRTRTATTTYGTPRYCKPCFYKRERGRQLIKDESCCKIIPQQKC